MTRILGNRPVLALACMVPLLVLTMVPGPLPDADRDAHSLWARQILATGRLTISPRGVVNDWRLYYPNTVPKPADLLLSLLAVWAGPGVETALWLLLPWFALYGAVRAASPEAAGLAGLFLGINPVFLHLCLSRSPAVPFLGLLFLGYGRSRTGVSDALASLVRPEGFFFGLSGCTRARNRAVCLGVLLLSAGVWALLNLLAGGDLFWSGREVRYCVTAMGYATPNPVTFLPWVFLRGGWVVGPVLLAVLLAGLREWPLRVPAGLNLLMLWAGLGFGSLVLPRYADQVFLLAVPYAAGRVVRSAHGSSRMILTTACLLGALLPWGETLSSWRTEIRIRRNLPETVALLPPGVIAANELVVPRLALLSGVADPIGRYVALDRAVWEGAEPESLSAFGVTAVVLVDEPFYLSEHARVWLDRLEGRIPVYRLEGAQP